MELPQPLIENLIMQFPVVAILVWLLFRLDRRIAELILVICDLAEANHDFQVSERLARYITPPPG